MAEGGPRGKENPGLADAAGISSIPLGLPKAVATGGATTGAGDAVSPRRAAVVAGLAITLLALAGVFVIEPPAGVLRMLGGPKTELARYGGLRMLWTPPPGIDVDELSRHYNRQDGAFVIDVPEVAKADVAETAERLGGAGRLEFHVVREVPEMVSLIKLMQLPMRNAKPVDAEPDQWRPEQGGGPIFDYYLHGTSRAAIEQLVADAERQGWHLPAGTHFAYEYRDRDHDWRSYVIDDAVALDGGAIANAIGGYDPNTNRPIVMLEFTREGSFMFGDLTARIVGHKLATVLDGEVKSAPIINSAIRGGRAQITMGGGDALKQEKERDALVHTLGSGVLPRGGHIVEARYVEPESTFVRLMLARLLLAALCGLVGAAGAFGAVRVLRPQRRREAVLPRTTSIVPKLAWTALPLAVYVVGSQLVLPGVNGLELMHVLRGGSSLFGQQTISVFALGVTPIITSYVIVEVVASIVPRWRKLRDLPEGRRKLGIAVGIATALVATVQGYFVAVYMEALSRGGADVVSHPGMGFRLLTTATLVAGAMSLAWLASLATQRGIGNGYAVLAAGSWLLGLPSAIDRLSHAEIMLFACCALAIWAVYLVASSWRTRELRTVGLPTPVAGIAPLSDAGGLMTLIAQLAALGVIIEPYRWMAPLQYESIAFAILIVMTVVWSYAFARPSRRREQLARAGVEPASWEMWLRATALSVLVLVVIRAIARVAFRVDGGLGHLGDPVMLVTVAATMADLWGETRARRAGLVAVWPLHDPLLADALVDMLGTAGIPAHIQHRRLRSLSWIFGSYVPMHVLVPADQAEAAHKTCRSLFE